MLAVDPNNRASAIDLFNDNFITKIEGVTFIDGRDTEIGTDSIYDPETL
jgi:hypothetical protein